MGFELEFIVHLFVWTMSCGFYLFIFGFGFRFSTLKIKNKNSYVVHVCVIDILLTHVSLQAWLKFKFVSTVSSSIGVNSRIYNYMHYVFSCLQGQ